MSDELWLAYVEVPGTRGKVHPLILASGPTVEALWSDLERVRRLNPGTPVRLHVAHAEGAPAEALLRAFSGVLTRDLNREARA